MYLIVNRNEEEYFKGLRGEFKSMNLFLLQSLIFQILIFLVWGLGVYALILLIKALKIYINKNS